MIATDSHRIFPLACLVFMAFQSACATRLRHQTPAPKVPVAQQGQAIPKTPAPDPAQLNLVALWSRVSDPILPYSVSDKVLIEKLAVDRPGGIEEAIIVMGQVRETLAGAQTAKGKVQEEDLFKNGGHPDNSVGPQAKEPAQVQAPQVTATKPALEGPLLAKAINLAEAIERNPLLKSFDSLHLAQEALKCSDNSETFTKAVSAVIAKEASKWQTLAAAEPAAEPITPTGELPAAVPPSTNSAPSAEVALPLLPGEATEALPRGDSVLVEAQRLADRGYFRLAIDRAGSIAPTDPAYPAAKEKIKRFSNKAVQVLRQRAAQAFQSAMPVTDLSAKAAYLEQAGKYLNEALAHYPAADQLGTVRDNLTVISKNLASINASKETGKANEQEQ